MAILLEHRFDGPGTLEEKKAAFRSIGVAPFIHPAIADPAFAELLDGILPAERVPRDKLHLVSTYKLENHYTTCT